MLVYIVTLKYYIYNTTLFKHSIFKTVEGQKINGIVKFFNESKGFGFIKHDNSSDETFVHVSGLKDQVKQDDRVEFEVQNGRKGLNAINVKKVN